jgi:acetyltransferase-like isoleucine patch superfamily enzyme
MHTADVYLHPTALVESDDIGAGTRIWAFSHVLQGAVIGSHCNIGDHCFVEGGARIGNAVTIKNSNELWQGVTLEDGVFIGPKVVFTNDRYPRSPRLSYVAERYVSNDWLVPTVVEQGASLGAGAVIIAGVRIGAFATVAAGSVVTHDVAPHSLAYGVPARHRGWVCRCGMPLPMVNQALRCTQCRLSFEEADGKILLLSASAAQTTNRQVNVP